MSQHNISQTGWAGFWAMNGSGGHDHSCPQNHTSHQTTHLPAGLLVQPSAPRPPPGLYLKPPPGLGHVLPDSSAHHSPIYSQAPLSFSNPDPVFRGYGMAATDGQLGSQQPNPDPSIMVGTQQRQEDEEVIANGQLHEQNVLDILCSPARGASHDDGSMAQEDILQGAYPPPSTGRRGRDHIDDAIRNFEMAQGEPLRPASDAVPWGGSLQPPKPETPRRRSSSEGRFEPMRNVARQRQQRFMSVGHVDAAELQRRNDFRDLLCRLSGFSVNYKGDIGNAANRSADIPEELNCSLWIVGLHPDMTVARLLGAVARLGRTGKVFATVISGAQPDRGHTGSAAKIVFFTRAGAERLKSAIDAGRLDGVAGRRVRASYNRIRSAPQAFESGGSRVLFIWGPRHLVNVNVLARLFSERIEYQTETVLVHEDAGGRAMIEWRFGSYRAQAQAVSMYLSKEHSHTLRWRFGRDPCDEGRCVM